MTNDPLHPDHAASRGGKTGGLTQRLLLLWAWVKAHAALHDVITRVLWSFGQQFAVYALPIVSVLASTGTTASLGRTLQVAALAGAGAAVTSLVFGVIQWLTGLHPRNAYVDLVVRLARTFLASVAGAFGTGLLDVVNFHWGPAISAAVGVAVLSYLKTLVVNGGTVAPQAKVTVVVGDGVLDSTTGVGAADDGVPRV